MLTEESLTLTGDPADLAKAVAACRDKGRYVVPSFVREWRTGLDENGHWKINGLPVSITPRLVGSDNESQTARVEVVLKTGGRCVVPSGRARR